MCSYYHIYLGMCPAPKFISLLPEGWLKLPTMPACLGPGAWFSYDNIKNSSRSKTVETSKWFKSVIQHVINPFCLFPVQGSTRSCIKPRSLSQCDNCKLSGARLRCNWLFWKQSLPSQFINLESRTASLWKLDQLSFKSHLFSNQLLASAVSFLDSPASLWSILEREYKVRI